MKKIMISTARKTGFDNVFRLRSLAFLLLGISWGASAQTYNINSAGTQPHGNTLGSPGSFYEDGIYVYPQSIFLSPTMGNLGPASINATVVVGNNIEANTQVSSGYANSATATLNWPNIPTSISGTTYTFTGTTGNFVTTPVNADSRYFGISAYINYNLTGAGLPWLPAAAPIYVASVSGYNAGGTITGSPPIAVGGNSGNVTITLPVNSLQDGLFINLGTPTSPLIGNASAPVVGILALSEPQWVIASFKYLSSTNRYKANTFIGGNAGDVSVTNNVMMTGYGSNAIGIVAASIGGDVAFTQGSQLYQPSEYYDRTTVWVSWPGYTYSQAGNGGNSSVSLTSASILLRGINSIGVLSISTPGVLYYVKWTLSSRQKPLFFKL